MSRHHSNEFLLCKRALRHPGLLALLVALSATPHTVYAETEAKPAIEEVVVTANRRAQNVQDVASSITVFGGDELDKAGSAGVKDYIFSIPGADVVETGTDRKIAIRGISNLTTRGNGVGASASPIGLYLGDTPIQGNGILPDMDLYDLARIEILKGPQGTLYGEGSQGGAIKMIPRSAVPGELEAKLEFSYGRTYNAEAHNSAKKGAINVPLSDRWGLRVVGSTRSEGLFIDYFNLPDTDSTGVESTGWRAHLDGFVTDRLSASLMVLDQKHRVDQFPSAQREEGDLRNRNLEPQFADTDFSLAGLTLKYEFDFAELVSSTSAFENERSTLARQPFLGPTLLILTYPILGVPPPIEPNVEREWVETDNLQTGFAQELRLVSTGDAWLQWIGGVFYRQRDNDFHFFITNSDVNDLPPPTGPGITEYFGVEKLEQYAVFGELSARLPWNLEALVGLRAFREDVELQGRSANRSYFYAASVQAGYPDGYGPIRKFGIETEEITPKYSLSWYPTDAMMIYGQVSKGVRSGGANHNALTVDVTPLFKPDKLWAYEAGVKSEWFDGALVFNVTTFRNEWEDLQVGTGESGSAGALTVSVGVILNVASAYTQGTEFELRWHPLRTLTLGVSGFAGEGEIEEGDPQGQIAAGTAMPQLAEKSYSAMIRYAPEWAFFGLAPSFTVNTQKTGERTAFPETELGEDPHLPRFQTWNAMLDFSGAHWSLGFSVDNFTDERPELGVLWTEGETVTYGRPRTWTARLAYQF